MAISGSAVSIYDYKGDVIKEVNPLPVSLYDSSGNNVSIVENTHTGNYELLVQQENHICTDNTTTNLLLADEIFTGEWQEHLNYQEINISISTDVDSAEDGLAVQWSSDGVTVEDTDKFNIYANAGTNYTPNPAFRYVRLVYTNGSSDQSFFSLMTILRKQMTGGSFHRIDSTLKDDSDGRLVLSVPKLRTAQNTYVSQSATNSGNVKTSIEELESQVSSNNNTQLNTSPHTVDEFGNYTHILGDNIFKGALITIPPEHHEIHCGDSYEMSYIADLSNGGVLNILIIVPNEGLSETNPGDSQGVKQYHLKGTVTTEAEATIEFFEGTTVSANGTAIDVFCRNRNYSSGDEIDIYHTPTVTSTGTRLIIAKSGSGRSVGGLVGRSDEFILKDNTIYLLRITNDVTTNEWVNVNLDYYVHPGV